MAFFNGLLRRCRKPFSDGRVGGGRYSYRYDTGSRPSAILAPWGDRVTYGWDAADRRLVERYSNDSRASYSYDVGDRVTRLTYLRSAGTTVSSFGYRYDNAGNKIGSDEFLLKPGTGTDAARLTWSYDATYRLGREERSGAGTTVTWDIAYGYDPASSRTVKRSKVPASAAETRTTYTFDAASQLARSQEGAARTTFAWNPTGALTRQIGRTSRTTCGWDLAGNNALVLLPDGTRYTQGYDPLGNRISASDASGTARWAYADGPAPALYVDAASARTDFLTEPGTGKPFALRSGSTSWPEYDALGFGRLSATATSTLNLQTFSMTGERLFLSGTPLVFGFRGAMGAWEDAFSLQVIFRRYVWLPSLGRFINRTPAVLRPDEPKPTPWSLGGPADKDCFGIMMYDHNEKEGMVINDKWSEGLKKRCPNFTKNGVCKRSEVMDFVKENKCCEVVLLGHRGGDHNFGGIVTYCDKKDPHAASRILPDDTLEAELGKHFAEHCKGNCKGYIASCSSAVYKGPTERLAQKLNCIVCGTTNSCPAWIYIHEKVCPIDEVGRLADAPFPQTYFRCYDPRTKKWFDDATHPQSTPAKEGFPPDTGPPPPLAEW